MKSDETPAPVRWRPYGVVAESLGVTPATLRRWARDPSTGCPPLVAPAPNSTVFLIDQEAVTAWLDRRSKEEEARRGGAEVPA